MSHLVRLGFSLVTTLSVVLGGLAFSCANGVDDAQQQSQVGKKPDAGSSIDLPHQEICANGKDDDGDGLVDEGCSCSDSGSSTEFQVNCGATCVPDNAHEETCADGKDNDCDGLLDCADSDCQQAGSCGCAAKEAQCSDKKDDDCDGLLDCDDPDCRHPGTCGCTAAETVCGDGKDDDCDGRADCEDEECQGCTPGSVRYCAEPGFCALGSQTCGPTRQWGACTEQVATGCFGEGLSPEVFQCCVASGFCCQDTNGKSAGNCAGIDECNAPEN